MDPWLTFSIERRQNMSPLQQLLENVVTINERSSALFRFPDLKGKEYLAINTTELAKYALKLSSSMQNTLAPQTYVLIAMPYGMDFASTLLACFAANVVAVPFSFLSAEATSHELTRLSTLYDQLARVGSVVVLTNSATREALQGSDLCKQTSCITLSDIRDDVIATRSVRSAEADQTAIVLFSSGSSSEPKGIPLSHENVWHQILAARKQWSVQENSRVVTWLLPSHNFGLHFGLLVPFFSGAESTFAFPQHYMKRPAIWFETIRKFGATHVAGPNFALDICADFLSPNHFSSDTFDTVTHIVCGGEPVRKKSVERFFRIFGGIGARMATFHAHYGLSETGALATWCGEASQAFIALDADHFRARIVRDAADVERRIDVANCGTIDASCELRIVCPEREITCKDNQVGEIWVKSPAIAKNYLVADSSGKQSFGCAIRDTNESGFFRTGDLGFIKNRSLYIAGREKEVVVVRGKNHFPADLEATIAAIDGDVSLKAVVFSIDSDDTEAVVALVETNEQLPLAVYATLAQRIRERISTLHGLTLADLAFAEKDALFAPSAGKLKRRPIKDAYLANRIVLLRPEQRKLPSSPLEGQAAVEMVSVVNELRERVFLKVLGDRALEFHGDSTFADAGLDSMQCMRLAGQIEDVFGLTFEPTLLFKYRTLSEIAMHLTAVRNQEKKTSTLLASTSITSELPVSVAAAAYPGDEPIAVVSIHCQFPGGANDVEAFWNLISSGDDAIGLIEHQRPDLWKAMQAYPDLPSVGIPRWAGLLKDVDKFDAGFFGISRREAECMDPQQRKVLEFLWELIELSGYNPFSLGGQRIGLFVGVHNNDYSEILASRPELMSQCGAYIDSGTHLTMIPNRASRWFNFTGPSEAINTACSSSLVAVQRAVESLRRGECASAAALGVNLILTPRVLLASASAGMLSQGGRCKPLDAQADGFVRSEGIGGVLLKPLSKAIADGDTIHGVIRGVAVNHDGRSNSLRAPNIVAQKELLISSYAKAGIDPSTISYIELHGTGTALGDPIEIQALKEAFATFDPIPEVAQCGIGSVKSNIGHTESVAGLAGMIKVLLAFKNRMLPKTRHFSHLNPLINLSSTPFRVVEKNEDWSEAEAANGLLLPRRAGVSSFGFGGVNAHVVLEEYLAAAPAYAGVSAERPALVVLSARNEERLQVRVQQLLAWLASRTLTPVELADLAYTLQVGREAMEARLALIVTSREELQGKLQAYLDGERHIEEGYSGEVKRNKETLAAFAADEDMTKTIDAWLAKGKYAKVLDLWVKGGAVDWDKLYGAIKPRRMSLPTYPFARERYWVPEAVAAPTLDQTSVLHPLLHRNTSDLQEQRFSSTFSGREFFLADHQVQGQRLLPGAAQLELARAAVEYAMGERPAVSRIRLEQVVFARPVIVGEAGLQVHIALAPQDDGAIAFELYSDSASGSVVHSQGRAVLVSDTAPAPLDIALLQQHSAQQQATGTQCYAQFAQIGLTYGPSFQSLQQVQCGQDDSGQTVALGQLSLPALVLGSEDAYLLHPSLLDGALQASIGLLLGQDVSERKMALPFAVEALDAWAPVPAQAWAVIRYSPGSDARSAVQKLDVHIMDDQGQICVRLQGFGSRVVETAAMAEPDAQDVHTLLLQPQWKAQAVEVESIAPEYEQRIVLLCDKRFTAEELQDHLAATQYLQPSKENSAGSAFIEYTHALIKKLQSVVRSKPVRPMLIQIVVPSEGEGQTLAGLSGLLKTAKLENPHLCGQVILVESTDDSVSLAAKLNQNGRSPNDQQIRYQHGTRMVLKWEEVPTTNAEKPWKAGGVYLITGATGGLGRLLAKEIAQQTNDVTLILTSRSALNDEQQGELDRLGKLGARVEYHSVDVSDRQTLTRFIHAIHEKYGRLNGVVHSAGVIRDSLLMNKTAEQIHEVLASKATGLANLDEASADLALDCFICFSSIAGAFGNVGQADYAAANGFLDAYMGWRAQRVQAGQRQGRSLSINWPLWEEGGMQVDAAMQRLMRTQRGMAPMTTRAGMAALYQAWASGQSHVLVMAGEPARLRQQLLAPAAPARNAPAPSSPASPADLADKALEYIKKLLAAALKLPAHQIDAQVPMDKYGIDSVMVMQLTAQLEETFGPLSKTLFFEYQTIAALSGYFVESHRARLLSLLSLARPEPAAAAAAPTLPAPPAAAPGRRRARFVPAVAGAPAPSMQEDIAIIGLAGRYPQAPDLASFWDNLRSGKDCITEIPAQRWDHRRYFDSDKNKAGKTCSKWGGFLDGVDQFDPLFFNISPREAEFMDPQERLFLECAYSALEDAGYTPQSLAGEQGAAGTREVGVYVGVMYQEYQLYGAQEQLRGHAVALSGIAASIANRVSYFLNLHGPSMAIDTMCSSSLSAIHLACQSLQQGSCTVAIAGGVNVSLHPNKYLALAQGKFVSSKGRCESFGEGGDGYVPGEGVGALLLKRKSQAIADGDHIYGVIKGSMINAGGKTNGYTVPNPHAQAEVIRRALRQAQVDPRTLSYIEAHGTGTSLGDPIEITGLSKVLQEHRQDKQFCAIGSVKSNIGHGESAAGIAGVTKVLLQMRHGQLAPSLHSQRLNPHIDFANSPFVVQQELAPWRRPQVEIDGQRREYPRRAGVSSFGAGGANAHVVLEEYLAPMPAEAGVSAERPALVVLSARNEERLQARVRQLVAWLGSRTLTAVELAELAYTLQVGREAMEARLALIVTSSEELQGKLQAYLDGERHSEEVYSGEVKRNKETLAAFAADEDMGKTIDAWLAKGKHAKVLDLWTKGLPVDWNKLYGAIKPRRMSLPTYPFARERYWVPQEMTKGRGQASLTLDSANLHPLVHRNTSGLHGLRFSSTFSGREFFLADHQVQGQRVLPGAAQLELARAAVERVAGVMPTASRVRLQQVTFARPVIVGEAGLELHIALVPQDEGGIAFELYSESTSGRVVYSQGRAALVRDTAPAPLNLTQLQRHSAQRQATGPQCYMQFVQAGLTYGPGFQSLQQVQCGQDDSGQTVALGQLSLPASALGSQDAYVLHPSLLDGALQAGVGLLLGQDVVAHKMALPFAVEALDVWAPVPAQAWAVIHYSAGSDAHSAVQKLDVHVVDAQGRICVRMHGFSSRVVESAATESSGAAVQTLLFQPQWRMVDTPVLEQAWDGEHWVLLCGQAALACGVLRNALPEARCLELQSTATDAASRYTAYAWQLLSVLQELPGQSRQESLLVQLVVADEGEDSLFSGLLGLLKSARQENPGLLVQLLLTASATPADVLARQVQQEAAAREAVAVRYWQGQRQVRQWQEMAELRAPNPLPWAANGVYLISGGAGGLGHLIATEMASRAPGITLVLTGRSPANERILSQLAGLQALGAQAEYLVLDVSDEGAVRALVERILQRHGRLSGVIHSAGVLNDSFVAKKTRHELEAVMAPKVKGLMVLDEATASLPLECFVAFSSIAAELGNVGQTDYAAANGFMDAYMTLRAQRVQSGQRQGRSISINWPLWEEGGMQLDASTRKRMWRSMGMAALSTSSAMLAFEQIMMQPGPQVVVLAGERSRLTATLATSAALPRLQAAQPANRETAYSAEQASELQARVQSMLVGMVSESLKIGRHDIDVDSELSEFGFDSITLTKFGNQLSEKYNLELSPTVFFEHPTLERLSNYLVHEHRELLMSHLQFPVEVKGHEAATIYDVQAKALGLASIAKMHPAEKESESGLTNSPQPETESEHIQIFERIHVINEFDSAVLEANPENPSTILKHVGMRILNIDSAPDTSAVLYYPTTSMPGPISLGGFAPTVALEGLVPSTVKGLILIAHGMHGNGLAHYYLAEGLARQGYLVAAPQSQGFSTASTPLKSSMEYFSRQSRQLRHVLDTIFHQTEWGGRIPARRIGAIGYSAGSFGILELLGATTKKHQNDMFDERIHAAILMAPLASAFEVASLKRIQVPLKIYTAENDELIPNRSNGNWLRDEILHAEFEEIKDAGHFVFVAQNSNDLTQADDKAEHSSCEFDVAKFHRKITDDVLVFFDTHLHGLESDESTNPDTELAENCVEVKPQG